MINNYTPLDIDKLKKEKNNLNTILLLMVILTMMVLSVVLFILIQKKITEGSQVITQPIPTMEFEPTETPTPLSSPPIFDNDLISTPESSVEASDTPILLVTPASESNQINN